MDSLINLCEKHNNTILCHRKCLICEQAEEIKDLRNQLDIANQVPCSMSQYDKLQAENARIESEKQLLAMLASDTPQFNSPILCARAKTIRDAALKESEEL